MSVSQLLDEVRGRGVELRASGEAIMFRPKRNLTPELVEGLRIHKAAILERLGKRDRSHILSAPEKRERSHNPLLNSPVIRDTAEVLELVRARLGEMAPEHKMDAPYPPAPPGRDPLAHKHTDKALYFAGARRRELERRERDGLPPWIRLVDGGGKA